MTPLAFITKILAPFRVWIGGMVLVSFFYAADMSLRPSIIKVIINRVQGASPDMIVGTLAGPLLCYIGLSFMLVIAFRFHDYVWLKFNPPVKRHVSLALMERMAVHSQSLYHDNFAGSLANKIKDVMSGIPDLIQFFVKNFLSSILGLPMAMGLLYTVHKGLAVSLFVWSSFFIVASFYFSKRAVPLSYASAEARSTVMGQIVDILSNMISVRLFATASREQNHLTHSLDNYVVADQRRDWFFFKVFSVQGCSFVIYQAFCIYILIRGYSHGHITAGDFALVFTINLSLIDRLWALFTDIGKFATLWGEVTQGLRIVLSPSDIVDMPGAKPLTVTHGKIVFDRVSFHYKGVEPLFENKSITIEPGQKVGLVGYSGGGKSTFVSLMLRLYDVSGGRILIDGQDIKAVTQDSLRRAIAMIPQDPSLFHRSLMNNIRYGNHEATKKDIIEAAKRAHAHDFIMALPKGYDSMVGERGVKLSGGQRQRIAIARAILKNAPILMLDEATSQLDSVTEADIQESLWTLMQGKTTIVIAHRLSTLLHMDRILVFDKGCIVEGGSHTELLHRGGLYATLWNAQVGGFLGDR